MIASDGLEYADLAARVRGEPADNTRNGNILSYRRNTRWTEEQVRQYIEGFDEVCPDGYPGPSHEFSIAHATGLERAGKRSGPLLDYSRSRPSDFIAQPTLMKAASRKDSHDQRN